MEDLTVEQTADRLQEISEKVKPYGSYLSNVALVLRGKLIITDEAKREVNKKLQRLANELFDKDFVTVMNAMVHLLPNIVRPDFSRMVDKTVESELLPAS